jgi:HSP20 family protein
VTESKQGKRKGKQMQEQVKQQPIPVKVYRTAERLMIAAPMAGLEPENMLVEVTDDGRLILHGDQTFPAQLTLERVTPTHGQHKGNAGHLATCVQT